jgi:antitoxin component YwqK of YwqJK toxin-antitoxin module
MIALALALVLGAPPPLECPSGAIRRGGQPADGFFEEWCETPAREGGGGGKREGPTRTYYDNGIVWVESNYRDGKLDGPFVERYRRGTKASQGVYLAGVRDGNWTFFHEDGTVQEEAGFTKGVPDGRFADYWPNGRPRTSGRRCLGVQCGKWVTYDESGRLIGSVEYGEQRATP